MGERTIRGEGAVVVDGGEGAVDDASNVQELFGRRPDKKRDDRGVQTA